MLPALAMHSVSIAFLSSSSSHLGPAVRGCQCQWGVITVVMGSMGKLSRNVIQMWGMKSSKAEWEHQCCEIDKWWKDVCLEKVLRCPEIALSFFSRGKICPMKNTCPLCTNFAPLSLQWLSCKMFEQILVRAVNHRSLTPRSSFPSPLASALFAPQERNYRNFRPLGLRPSCASVQFLNQNNSWRILFSPN